MTREKKACTCPVQAQPSWAELRGDVSSDVTWANVFHLRLVDSRMHSADPEAHCVAWLSTRRAGLLAEMWLRVCSAASLFTTDHRRPSEWPRDLPAGHRDPFRIYFGNNPKTLPVLFILLLRDTVASPGSGHVAAQGPSSEPTTYLWLVCFRKWC